MVSDVFVLYHLAWRRYLIKGGRGLEAIEREMGTVVGTSSFVFVTGGFRDAYVTSGFSDACARVHEVKKALDNCQRNG